MIDFLMDWLVRRLLALRYRVRVSGLDQIAARGTRGIVFFPNHPALIDPIIMMSTLFRRFRPRVLADKDQIDRPLIRSLARRAGVVPLPDIRKEGPGAKAEVEAKVRELYEGLRRDGNMLLYPSGHIYRTKNEDLRGNSGVETILQRVPGVRVVLVRTRGLWGSRFSMASGEVPRVGETLRQGLLELLASFIFFSPRREVTLEFVEPADFPRGADRNVINHFIERFYNQDAPPATYVPRTIWERGALRELPEPVQAAAAAGLSEIPESVRALVNAHLKELGDVSEVRPDQRLAQDLGLDSLDRAELALWIGKEFGFNVSDVDAIQTVGDVLLAARGLAVVAKHVSLKPIPSRWFAARSQERAQAPRGDTIPEAFLDAARRNPDAAVVADQFRGVASYRDLILMILALRPQLRALPGERLGLMLPASVAAAGTYLATMFAEKTPVMVNWTTGARNLAHALAAAEVRHVLTSRLLVERIRSQGIDVASITDRFVFVEDLAARVGRWSKATAFIQSRMSWKALDRARPTPIAAILFTSGSEALPKVVPLTHSNLLTNIRDTLAVIDIRRTDALLGFLPPFHSFGLTVTTILPIICGLRVAFHPNPTEAWVIAKLVEAYKPTVLLGTPTFLSGIVRAASGQQLQSLRIAVTGAETCPERTFAALAERCPGAIVLEGYGITECSPIVAATRAENLRRGTIGEMLPSFEYAIVDPETFARRARPAPGEPEGRPGLLLVRGPCVFEGYLGDAPSPFVEHDGKKWYRTGDLVSESPDRVLTFRGRIKRFVKLGGEMISLPAIESVLEAAFPSENDQGPAVAIEATPNEEHPEIVLFTTREIDRAAANQQIRTAGLSPLHNVSRVQRVVAIPLLGTGKTDYKALRALLAAEA